MHAHRDIKRIPGPKQPDASAALAPASCQPGTRGDSSLIQRKDTVCIRLPKKKKKKENTASYEREDIYISGPGYRLDVISIFFFFFSLFFFFFFFFKNWPVNIRRPLGAAGRPQWPPTPLVSLFFLHGHLILIVVRRMPLVLLVRLVLLLLMLLRVESWLACRVGLIKKTIRLLLVVTIKCLWVVLHLWLGWVH